MGRVAVVLGSLLLTSCSLRDLEYLENAGPDGGTSDVASSDSPAMDSAGCAPGMVRVDSFCIDATEVTERDYTAFLDAKKGDTSGQIDVCKSNTSFQPDPLFFPKNPILPVRAIDWCDAFAYCAWAGKRLCGKIGGGAVSKLSADDPELDQWYRACSAAGTRIYPYGNTYDPTACRSKESGGGAVAVKTMTKCEGGYAGIFDMGGNVWEWEDSCDDAGSCSLRGGSWANDGLAVGCKYGPVHYSVDRLTIAPDRGIRCCSP
jgi:sulfatase modifying factor 1